MAYIGELISIGVAFSWTATALLSEFGSKRLGNLTLNVLRMALALLFSLVLFGVVTGNALPTGIPADAGGGMLLSVRRQAVRRFPGYVHHAGRHGSGREGTACDRRAELQ